MNFRRTFLIICFSLFVLTAQTKVFAVEKWLRVQTKNFELVGSASEKDLRRVATKLEQFRFVFKNLFTKMKFDSPIPTRVVVFKDDKSFQAYKTGEWVAGYFSPSEDINYIVLSAEGEKEDTYRVIFHEYIHFLVDNSFGRSNIPPWFNEGLAEYYEQFKIEDDQKVTLGGLNNEHLYLLTQFDLIKFDKFFTVDYYSMSRQTRRTAGIFYAQAWAFMHFLMHANQGARVREMGQFVDLLLEGKPAKFAFEKAFKTDYSTMENELRNYVGQRKFTGSIVTFKNKLTFDNELSLAPLPLIEAKAIQGDLLFRIGRLTEAEEVLAETLTLDPESSSANNSLGLLKLRQRKYPEAKKYFEKAIQTDQKNFLAYYNFALALSREEMTEYGFSSGFSLVQADKIRENLRRAIELNPAFAESYSLFAFVNVVRNEQLDESIEMIRKALAIAPGNQWYQMRLSELYMRSGNFDGARKIVQRIVLTAGDDRLKVYAENTLTRIDSLQSQMASLKDRRNVEVDGITDKPLSAEELAKRREKAMLESLNETLRIPGDGEERILGHIQKVDCIGKEIFVTVKSENTVKQFRISSFEALTLISFDPALVDVQFGCGVPKKKGFAVITYKPTTNSKAKTEGEIVSVEFVPENFRFLNEQ